MDNVRWARPLRLHLSVVIVILLVAISVPLMWLTYQQGTRSAIAAGDQQMRLLSRHAIDRYRSIFSDGYSAIAMTSVSEALLKAPPADQQAKIDFLIKALSGSSYIDGIYVGYPTGDFVQAVNVARNPKWREALAAPERTATAFRTIENSGPGGLLSTWRFLDTDGSTITERTSKEVTYDPRSRPWYNAAANGTKAIAVGPYVMATTKSLGLTLATPMSKDHAVVVGTDVLLEKLSSLLAQEAVSAHSRGYVFDDQKRIIVHSEKAMMDLILENLSAGTRGKSARINLPDPVLDAVRELLGPKNGQPEGTVSFLVGEQPYLAEISPVGFSGLVEGNTVVIAAPLSDFTEASVRLLEKALLISGILLAAGIVAALLVARLVSNSLSALTADARQIGDLEFSRRPPEDSYIAEINTLAGALASARDAIRNFALYVPRELVRKIVASGQHAAGGAARQEVTILFTDIRDFTTISERHSPEDVVAMLSTYFQLMNDIVERSNGVIVQYLGDFIYAMWNAPTPDPMHVSDACRCALELKAAIDVWNAGNRQAGRPELVTRFGLHTGAAVVGSVGAQARLQYTAMGDTVNVASRLEGINKQFGTTILASGAVKEGSGGAFTFRPLGAVQAKGRVEQIEIFELVS